MKKLHVLNAGCVSGEVKNTVDLFNAYHDGIQAENSSGGSVDRIRRMLDGEPCDLLILADDAIITGMLMPKHTKGYYVFAGNSMVIMVTNPDKSITDENWKQTLLDPGITFGHYDPYVDPGGYRSVMVCMLADSVEPGLSKKLLEHPGRRIYKSLEDKKADFSFSYMSNALKNGIPFAQLPDGINFSKPALNEHYATAAFDLDGDGKNIVRGSAICHALTIPESAVEPKWAMEFVKLFLQTNFEERGFLPRSGIVGDWQGPIASA